jgi:hypothetical protein
MRTKEQQNCSATRKDNQMLHQIKTVVTRSRDTLLSDALGATALMVILVVGLHLPNFS